MLCPPRRHRWLLRINHQKMRSGGNSPWPACVRVYTMRTVGVSSGSLSGSEIMARPCTHYAISLHPSRKKWQLLQEIAIILFVMAHCRNYNSHVVEVGKKLRGSGSYTNKISEGVGGPLF